MIVDDRRWSWLVMVMVMVIGRPRSRSRFDPIKITVARC
jgi:hypothetical protein